MNQPVMYFGYGSLVNRATRESSEKVVPATLHGWERQWAHHAHSLAEKKSPDRLGVCPLTISERSGSVIDGVLAEISIADLPLLDKRERGYERLSLSASRFSFEPASSGPDAAQICTDKDIAPDSTIYVYRSLESQAGWANEQYPLIQSYIDVVLSGYRSLFGEQGVKRFLMSTSGWNGPLVNDRDNPIYPRAVVLGKDELAWIDAVMEEVRQSSPRS